MGCSLGSQAVGGVDMAVPVDSGHKGDGRLKGRGGARERYLPKGPACPACVEPPLRLGVGAAQM